MEKQLLGLLGNTMKHVLGGLLKAFRAIALTGLIVALVAAAATEGVAVALTREFPPSGMTHLAAAALAIAFGYAAAITVAIEEILRTIIRAFELVIQEAEKLGKEAAQEAEKLGRVAIMDAEKAGRVALNDAGIVGRTVTGAVSGVVGGIAHEGRAIEQGVASHLPGQHSVSNSVAPSNTPTLPSGN